MDLSVSGTASAPVYNSASNAAGTRDTDSVGMSRKDLVAALNQALPGLSVAFGTLPDDQKEQEKLYRDGKLAGLTIHPDAAQRMQSDPAFRDSIIAAVKQDQKENGAGTVHEYQGHKIETVAHGTVVEKDGTINSWSFSKSESSSGDSSSDSKDLTDKLKSRLKEQMDAGKLSKERYEAAVREAEAMRAQGKSEEEIAARLREALLSALGPGDDPSVGIETVA
jgi:hypothetical protein